MNSFEYETLRISNNIPTKQKSNSTFSIVNLKLIRVPKLTKTRLYENKDSRFLRGSKKKFYPTFSSIRTRLVNTQGRENKEESAGVVIERGPACTPVGRQISTTEPISGGKTRFHLIEGEPWTVSLPRSTRVGIDEKGKEKKREEKKGKKRGSDRFAAVVVSEENGEKGGGGSRRRQTYDVVSRFVKIPAFQILEREHQPVKHLFNLAFGPSLYLSFVNPPSILRFQPLFSIVLLRILFIPIIFIRFLRRNFDNSARSLQIYLRIRC